MIRYCVIPGILSPKKFCRSIDFVAFSSATADGRKSSGTFPELKQGCTVEEAYNVGSAWLRRNCIDDSEDSARHLVCDAGNLGYRYSDFREKLMHTLNVEEVDTFRRYCVQRSKRVPVQYIIQNWDFYGLTFECKAPVLIPRPETEELVHEILYSGVLNNIPSPRILDVGTGTGAIGIALLMQLPNAVCHSIDVNPIAIELAKRNARSILGDSWQDRYQCVHSSFLDYVQSDIGSNLFDLVVSNPPYIPSGDIAQLQPEVRENEDLRALDGGTDGLDIVKDLIVHFPSLLRPAAGGQGGGRELWLEVSRQHPAMLTEWLAERHQLNLSPDCSILQCLPDMTGNPRFVRIKANHKQ